MAEPPGIQCQGRNPVNIKDGTMCAAQSPHPGITGNRSLADRAWDSLSWAGGEVWAGTEWVGEELWAGASWAGGELWAGTKWAGSAVWSGAEWAGVEIKAGVKWSVGEIRGGAVWLGNKVYDAYKYLLALFSKIKHAANWEALAAIAEPILGPTFMQAGVLWGIVESLGKDVLSLLELGKMVVLAGCYELLIHPDVATTLALNPTTMPMVLTALALKAVAHEIPSLATEMKKSDDQLKKMLADLWHMVSNWNEFLGFVKAMGQHIKQETVNDFNKLKSYAQNRSLANDFEAGRIMGRALYQIVMLILIVVSGIGAVRSALRFLARVPALLRAARILKYGGEVEEIIETEKVMQGVKDAEEIAEAEKIKEPPKPVEEEAPPKRWADPKKRPKYAKGQVDKVWEAAQDEDGRVYDPNTGEELFWDKSKSRAGQWDMGHMPEHEYRTLHKDYMDGKISEEEFLKQYRDPNNYRPESPSANRSHRYEAKPSSSSEPEAPTDSNPPSSDDPAPSDDPPSDDGSD